MPSEDERETGKAMSLVGIHVFHHMVISIFSADKCSGKVRREHMTRRQEARVGRLKFEQWNLWTLRAVFLLSSSYSEME